jgi:HD-like signal output (HDOD) protein
LPASLSNGLPVEDRAAADQRTAAYVRLSKLPPFRPAALKLLNLSVESRSAMRDFEEVFKSDPALTADLLLVANSAEFGLRARIETIMHALTYLGLERVRSLGCTIGFSFFVRNLPNSKYGRAVWTHSVATAMIAEAIRSPRRPQELYTAGILHDLGRLALLLSVGPPYEQALSRDFADMAEANESEITQFAVTHCEAGAVVTRQWGFPAALQQCIAGHHQPVAGRADDPPNLIRLACRMADWLGFPEVARRDLEFPEELPLSVEPDLLRERIAERVAAFG